MADFKKQKNRKLAEVVMKGLKSRNMTPYFAETKEEALKTALSIIPEGATVAWGGGMSAAEIGLKQAIVAGNYKEINRDVETTPEGRRKKELEAFGAEYFLASSNAVTEDGILVNIDGNANRVAAIAYGPEHIVMIVGMNKIAKDIDTAVRRARDIAATTNNMRFDNKTPCKVTGSCANCKSPDTICCQFLITRYSKHPGRIHVILVNEDLGF